MRVLYLLMKEIVYRFLDLISRSVIRSGVFKSIRGEPLDRA